MYIELETQDNNKIYLNTEHIQYITIGQIPGLNNTVKKTTTLIATLSGLIAIKDDYKELKEKIRNIKE